MPDTMDSTIAGLIERFGAENVVELTTEHFDGTVALLDRWVWIQKCELPPVLVTRPDGTEVEIHRPEKSQDNCNWFRVLATGIKNGQPYTRTERKSLKRKGAVLARGTPDSEVQVMDIVLIPDNVSWGMKYAIGESDDQRLVHMEHILAKWEE